MQVDIQTIAEDSKNKTRVVLFGMHSKMVQLIQYVLEYHFKTVDWVSNSETKIQDNDFIVLEATDLEAATVFAPTIAFLGSQTITDHYSPFLESLTQGGILVYPEFIDSLDRSVLQSIVYFRKLGYKKPELEKAGNSTLFKTDFGDFPISVENRETLDDIEGVKLFCQQLGIMEDDFYEALISF